MEYSVGQLVQMNPKDDTMSWYLPLFPEIFKWGFPYPVMEVYSSDYVPYYGVRGDDGTIVSLRSKNILPYNENLKVEDFV